LASAKKTTSLQSHSLNGEAAPVDKETTEQQQRGAKSKSEKKEKGAGKSCLSPGRSILSPSRKKTSLAQQRPLNGNGSSANEESSLPEERDQPATGTTTSGPSSEAPLRPSRSPSTKSCGLRSRPPPGVADPPREETNSEKLSVAGKFRAPELKKPDQAQCEGKERSLDCPSARLHPSAAPLPGKDGEQRSGRRRKKCAEVGADERKPQPESKNKFTWCGSCKGAKATAASAKSKRTPSTSPLKKLGRSSLSVDAADGGGNGSSSGSNSNINSNINSNSSNNKIIALNLSKYSPCASRLAASSKILSSDSVGGGTTSPESPLHVGRSRSPAAPSPALGIQRPGAQQPVQRSKSVSGPESCLTSPTSEATNLSCSPPGPDLDDVCREEEEEQHGDEEVEAVGAGGEAAEDEALERRRELPAPRAVAPASMIELNLERQQAAAHQSPR
jgi:hypothetical protein